MDVFPIFGHVFPMNQHFRLPIINFPITSISSLWKKQRIISNKKSMCKKRTTSSTASLIAFIKRTTASAIIVLIGWSALICGINDRITRNKKKALESRRNCSKRFLGMNVIILYLVVEIPFFFTRKRNVVIDFSIDLILLRTLSKYCVLNHWFWLSGWVLKVVLKISLKWEIRTRNFVFAPREYYSHDYVPMMNDLILDVVWTKKVSTQD